MVQLDRESAGLKENFRVYVIYKTFSGGVFSYFLSFYNDMRHGIPLSFC